MWLYFRFLLDWLLHPTRYRDDGVKVMATSGANEAADAADVEAAPDNPAGLWAQVVAHHMTLRCDRCGARATSRWTRGTETLGFCDHHTREHTRALLVAGFIRTRG